MRFTDGARLDRDFGSLEHKRATPPPTETKDLLAGGVYTSMSYAGITNVWGTPGRADGWDLERVIIEGYEGPQP